MNLKMNFLVQFLLFIALRSNLVWAITTNDFYSHINEPSEILARGDEMSEEVKLIQPILFYGDSYDHVYINTNGILTFGHEFTEFLNIPFPLEGPTIAPFYSNVDTTLTNDTAQIIFFQSDDELLLNRATRLVQSSFRDARDFRASALFVATWENVGHYNKKNNEQNTFQVAVISNALQTYVQFLYPRGGLNWIQAENGQSGLPDIRARAGFVAEDGRFFMLKGSGSDNVRYLSESSNTNNHGVWLYRVGPLEDEDNVVEPDIKRIDDSEEAMTCQKGGKIKCHSSAYCQDTALGFCCICKEGFYGNGYSCIKNDVPLRVIGMITGNIGNDSLNTQLQSYVVLADGRSYTAVSPLDGFLGRNMQYLEIIGNTVGWLFAKPMGKNLNGYQITGGKFNHTTTIKFAESGETLRIEQRYQGLNLWDQLAVEIKITGDLPVIPQGVLLSMDDYFEEFTASERSTLSAVSTHQIHLSSQAKIVAFTVYQEIKYDTCRFLEQANRDYSVTGRLKNSKITILYDSKDQALRIGMLSKIGVSDVSNPCTDGAATCGQNTICVPTSDDSYECNCKNGYAYVSYGRDNVETCVDIDECSGINICDENAMCYNEPGGYHCNCNEGFEGNGHECYNVSASEYPVSTPQYPVTMPSCDSCSDNAICTDGVCVCRQGFHGTGQNCQAICGHEYIWNGHECVKTASNEDYEIQPNCDAHHGCSCPDGYTLYEYAFGSACRIEELDNDETDEDSENMPISCDVRNTCSENAICEFNDNLYKYECVCNSGYDGNGYHCVERDVSCADEDICDEHASCAYSEVLKKSVCNCEKGYEGDGKQCHLAAECETSDDCGIHSNCEEGLCMCQEGYERDISDFCVLIGSCGGAYCVENAQCKWDDHQRVSYCHCPTELGFEGDGIHQCKSIPPSCNVRNNCGLYASCVPNYRTTLYECVCDVGYFGDGFLCTPERNCRNIPSLCDYNAQCASTTSGYKCICNPGYIGNGSVCKEPPRLEEGFLFVSQGSAAVRMPFNGKRGYPVSSASMAIGIDKDCALGRVYWSDISAKAIFSANYDGTDKKPFINENIKSPEGIAVDWVSRRIYWTDSGKDTIEVASLDNSTLRAVLINKNLVNPRGIAVDPYQNKIFWSDWNRLDPKIEWSNLDGTEREILLSSPAVKLPNSLAISSRSAELCFADAGTQKVDCIDSFSKHVRTIAGNLSYPFGLAITDDHYYWTDWTTKKIESIDVDGNRKPGLQTPLFNSHKMYGMTAVTKVCPSIPSACVGNNGDCPAERMCLVNGRAPSGKACKCILSATCNEDHYED